MIEAGSHTGLLEEPTARSFAYEVFERSTAVFRTSADDASGLGMLEILERAHVLLGPLGQAKRVPVAIATKHPTNWLVAFVAAVLADRPAVGVPPGFDLAATAGRFGASALIVDGRGLDSIETHVIENTPASHVDERLAYIQFTSGSTSSPRGVPLWYSHLLAMIDSSKRAYGFDRDDVLVSWLPPFHDLGFCGSLIMPAAIGATAVLMRPSAFLRRPQAWVEELSAARATVTMAPPSAYRMAAARFVEQPTSVDLTALDCAIVGAEPICEGDLAMFSDAFRDVGFRQEAFRPSYGLAEATVLVSTRRYNGPRWFDRNLLRTGTVRPASPSPDAIAIVPVGTPVGCTVEIRHPPGAGSSGVGEIVVDGPSVPGVYINDAHGAAEARASGSVATGDLGFLHDGDLYVVGREREILIIGGTNVPAHEVERAAGDGLAGHEMVATCAYDDFVDDGVEHVLVVAVRARSADHQALARRAHAAILARAGIEMTKVYIVGPRGISRTTSGKVQRSATQARINVGATQLLHQFVRGSRVSMDVELSPRGGPSPYRRVIAALADVLPDGWSGEKSFVENGGTSRAAAQLAGLLIFAVAADVDIVEILAADSMTEIVDCALERAGTAEEW